MIQPGYSVEAEIERYEAELRERLRARLDSETTRSAAEHEIEALVRTKRVELLGGIPCLGDLNVMW